jgi:hypothetical protein
MTLVIAVNLAEFILLYAHFVLVGAKGFEDFGGSVRLSDGRGAGRGGGYARPVPVFLRFE